MRSSGRRKPGRRGERVLGRGCPIPCHRWPYELDRFIGLRDARSCPARRRTRYVIWMRGSRCSMAVTLGPALPSRGHALASCGAMRPSTRRMRACPWGVRRPMIFVRGSRGETCGTRGQTREYRRRMRVSRRWSRQSPILPHEQRGSRPPPRRQLLASSRLTTRLSDQCDWRCRATKCGGRSAKDSVSSQRRLRWRTWPDCGASSYSVRPWSTW